MDKRSLLFTALALALATACRCAPAYAGENTDHRVAPGIHEVADDELARMRGRYLVGDSTVLWFGVEMVSTWRTDTGQMLQSTLTLSLDFSKNPNHPQMGFVPTVTIATIGSAPPVPPSPNAGRSVQSGGLANVTGMTQSVQVAGDHNAAGNVTSLNLQNGGSVPTLSATTSDETPAPTTGTASGTTPSPTARVAVSGPAVNAGSSTANTAADNSKAPPSIPVNTAASTPTATSPSLATSSTGTGMPDGRVASIGNASASATYTNDSAQVTLSVDGKGTVSQWIRPGSLGQTIALTADNQAVSNQLIVNMVTQSLGTSTSQLAHNLSQSLNFNRSSR